MGSASERAKKGWARHTQSAGGFSVDITFETPTLSQSLVVRGLAMKHFISVDTDEGSVNTKIVNMTIEEKLFVDGGYPVRNSNDEVDLVDHFATYTDSAGLLLTYRVTEIYPDRAVGMISMVLEDFKENLSRPIDLTAIAFSQTQIDLAWTLQTIDEDNVIIERSLDCESWSELISLPQGTVVYSDVGLTMNTIYFYRVRVVKGTSKSRFSNVDFDKTIGDIIILSGIYHIQPQLSGNDISYFTGDDFFHVSAGTHNRVEKVQPANPLYVQDIDPSDMSLRTLKFLNYYGNFDRFTDTVGGQEYGTGGNGSAVDVGIDNLYALAWDPRTVFALWEAGLTLANDSTIGGITTWRAPDIFTASTLYLMKTAVTGTGIMINPITGGTSALTLLSSTTNANDSSRWLTPKTEGGLNSIITPGVKSNSNAFLWFVSNWDYDGI